jgi:SNF2 family DNA or RNA helicase
MTKMLDLLHYYLEERGFDPCRIDGSIPWEERQVCHSAQPVRRSTGG